tara:strand:+ start:320 stop:589 length:270 start_codon:yes stop_codon:yes gene_type:complete
MEQLYVILEENFSLNECYGSSGLRDVLGVADSKESWEAMINKHYGRDVISTAKVKDVRDSGIEYVYTFYEGEEEEEIEITIENYQLNEL